MCIIISTSLSINTASVSAHGIELSSIPSVDRSVSVGLSVQKVYCGKTAHWIRMLSGMVSGVGRGMGVLDGGGDRRRRKGRFGVNLERPIVTKVAIKDQESYALFPNYFGRTCYLLLF